MFRVRFAAALVAASALAPAVQGWSKSGHMATGAIAYRVLKRDSPDTIPKVVALLKRHPYYDGPDAPAAERWKPKLDALATGAERDEFLFMLAARWADDARDDDDYYPPGKHYDQFHYINMPFKPPGQPSSVRVAPPGDINILRGYDKFLAQFRDGPTAGERAVGLCWVLHLIGDAHQPLHATSLFTEKFQKEGTKLVGDRGGTRFYIKKKAGSSSMSLHSYWDGLVTTNSGYAGNRKEVDKLLDNPAHAREKLAPDLARPDFDDWLDESFRLAKKAVYTFDGELIRGGNTKGSAEPLPTGYHDEAERHAERRAVLAGYRIADVLKRVLDE